MSPKVGGGFSRASNKIGLGYAEYSPHVGVLEAVEKCHRRRLNAVQLSGDLPVNFPENIGSTVRKAVRSYIETNKLNLHFHAPSDIPLASRHNQIRLGGLQRMAEFIELAADMGAKTFVFHPGRFAYYRIGTGRIVMAEKKVPSIYFERFHDSMTRLIESGAGRLELLLENTHVFSTDFIEVIDRFLTLPKAGLAWDIGHMLNKSRRDPVESASVTESADFFAERLDHVKLAHLHDITPGRSHLALGKGNLNIASYYEIFRRLNIEMIIEVFSESDLDESLKYLQSLEVKKLP